jgi:hypothetical protein
MLEAVDVDDPRSRRKSTSEEFKRKEMGEGAALGWIGMRELEGHPS